MKEKIEVLIRVYEAELKDLKDQNPDYITMYDTGKIDTIEEIINDLKGLQ